MRLPNTAVKGSTGRYYTSLLIIILFVVCFLMLICNWWNLSTQNVELLGQINRLQEQLNIGIDERDKCNQLRSSFEERIKKLEDELAFMHVQLNKDSIQSIQNVTNQDV
ncbi:uncharacterized protein [Chelonus insularis]|uniref:uncharacterized protein n=1 Tax=Chelonus insularis TaxID=460826 RepID=UPI00158D9A02|nr:uncharacterized protein LOC118072708 [Chelonus insularis]